MIFLPVSTPVYLARIPLLEHRGAAYHLTYTEGGKWLYRWELEPMKSKMAGVT